MEMQFYDYLIEKINECIDVKTITDIELMNKVIIFGSNSFELTKNMIYSVKEKNENAKIILVIQPNMMENMENSISNKDELIICDGGYTEKIIDSIKEKNNLKDIDGVIFYSQLPNDYGNINIFNIMDGICNGRNIGVYGINRDYEVYKYNNFNFYLKGLKLYNDMNDFIDESLNI